MSDEFRVLDDRTHALLRPGIWIGNVTSEPIEGIIDFEYQRKTIVPALVKLAEEIIQNSVDEYIRTKGEYATKIDITVANGIEGSYVEVKDNGRGIPIEPVGDSYRPVLAWTALRAGSNFDDEAGRITAGTNGVGSALVNIFSTSFTGTSNDGKKAIHVACSNNMQSIEWTIGKGNEAKRGTTVTFFPDLPRFGVDHFDDDHMTVIRDRITNMAIVYRGISFTFNGESIKFKNAKDIGTKFSEHAYSYSDDRLIFAIAPSGDQEEFRCLSYVNGIYIKNGGSHVDYFMNRIIETVRAFVKKKHKFDVLPNQIRQHILFASWVSGFKNPKFDSQVKERITNPQGEVSSIFENVDFEKVAKKILDTSEIIDPIIAALIRKRDMLEAAELAKKNKELDKTNLRKIVKFTDASEQTRRRDCLLMICEGDQANSSVLSARTPFIGSYPLRGKPLNVMGATTKDMMANAEFSDLLKITGLKIGTKVTRPEDLRFGKLVWVTDADMDGFAISGLLCAMIRKFWPELFSMGMIYRFRTPIMKVMLGKNELFFDSIAEFEAWAAKEKRPYKTRYLKGLGSSTAEDFRKYFSQIDDRLEKFVINSPEELDMLDMIYNKETGASDLRKQWLNLQ